MNFDEGVAFTQDRLAQEGRTMGELLGNFRSRISPILIGEPQWKPLLECASRLPITMGAFPFGFEIPLHAREPRVDFGVSMTSGTRTANFFQKLAVSDETDETARAVSRLFTQMDAENSSLREIVGRKLMLEYDIGSAPEDEASLPGIFLRPGERPIIGARNQVDDVGTVVDALVSCLGWEMSEAKQKNIKRAYLAQPKDTRMDSFGVFPSRSQGIRLAIMGFKSQQEILRYLENTGWPGQKSTVQSVIARFKDRVNIARPGLNIDVQEEGVGPTLGLTLIVKQRYTEDSRYWLDGLTDWNPLLETMRHENLINSEKLAALADWVKEPTTLFAKSGRFMLLRGIHHIKLVFSGNELHKAKAYVFIVLSGLSS